MKTLDELFAPVADAVEDALLIAFDGCHKIYVAMDEEQAYWFRTNYNSSNCSTHLNFTGTPEEMLTTLKDWWDESCGLKFIQSVTTNYDDPNRGFVSLIGQGDWMSDEEFLSEDDEDDEDDE